MGKVEQNSTPAVSVCDVPERNQPVGQFAASERLTASAPAYAAQGQGRRQSRLLFLKFDPVSLDDIVRSAATEWMAPMYACFHCVAFSQRGIVPKGAQKKQKSASL